MLTLLTSASLLLCVTTVAFWVRSESTSDTWTWQTAHDTQGFLVTQQDIVSNQGHLFIDRNELSPIGPAPFDPRGIAAPVRPMRITPVPLEHQSHPSENWVEDPNMITGPSVGHHHLLGFSVITDNEELGWSRFPFIVIPYWAIATVSILLPAVWIGRWSRRLRRRQLGLCVGCGYDLRATPDRCPECGTVPAQPTTS